MEQAGSAQRGSGASWPRSRSRLLSILTCALLCAWSERASASPLFELMGGGLGTGGLNARATGPSAASTYFNPALLPRAKQGLEIGWFVLNDAIHVDLDARSSAVNVPDSALDRVQTNHPPVPTSWLEQGCVSGQGGCIRDLQAQPRQSRGSSDNVHAYQMIGLVNHLLNDYLTLGLYALVPLSGFTQANSFFVDEREQFVSNSLHPELYSDRLTPVSLSFGAASRINHYVSVGLSFTLALANQAKALAYVGNSAQLEQTLELSTKVDVSAKVAPHLAVMVTPTRDWDLSLTLHSPQKMEIATTFDIYLPNGDVQRATRVATHSWLPWTLGLGNSYVIAKSEHFEWQLVNTITFERWSQYLNRQNEHPTKDYEWRDTFNGALGARMTHDQRLSAFLDVSYRPSPVPLQTGRTNYVDNNRYGMSAGVSYDLPFPKREITLRFGAQAQLHLLQERHQNKIDPRAPKYAGKRYSQLVVDEFPDDSTDISTGQPLSDAAGLQTNNPGWPGFSSRGFLLGGGATISLLY